MRGLSISHEPVNGIISVVSYNCLIRIYLFVPSGLLRNWPLHACRDFVQSVLLCLWLLTLIHVWGIEEDMRQTNTGFFCLYTCLFVVTCIQVSSQVICQLDRLLERYCWLTRNQCQTLSSTWRAAMCLLVTRCSQHTDEFYVQPQSHLAPCSMCHFPFSLTHYRRGYWPCAFGSCTRADVVALHG